MKIEKVFPWFLGVLPVREQIPCLEVNDSDDSADGNGADGNADNDDGDGDKLCL